MRLEITRINSDIEMFEPLSDGDDGSAELAAVSRLYNRQLGPIVSLSVHRPGTRDLPLFSSSCGHSPISGLIRDLAVRLSTGDGPLIPGGGKGATLDRALRGALGETAERLLAVLEYQAAQSGLRLATHAELTRAGTDALGPERLHLFAPEQHAASECRWTSFTPDTPLRWIEGHFLLSGEPVLCPAQLVFLYYERVRGEAAIGYPTTGGLAFHADRRRAVLHGLYEWVERDAINVGWARRAAPRRVEVDLRPVLPAAVPAGLDIQVFLATVDMPLPVLTVMARDRDREDLAFLAGGGAWSSRRRALTQALYELAQCRAVLDTLSPASVRRVQPATSTEAMNDFLDATVFYGYPPNEHLLDWYTTGDVIAWEDVPSVDFGTLEEEWEWMLSWVRARGLDPVVIDFDASSWPGAADVKVLVPELTTAWVPSDPYLGHPRYYRPFIELGRPNRALRFEELNRLPLPFP